MLTHKLLDILRFRSTDEFRSEPLRQKFSARYGIHVKLYSYGCFDEKRLDRDTHIGRYCSFSNTSRVMNRNHGLNFISTTPFLYNSTLRVVENDLINYETCRFSDDVWVGHGAMILPSSKNIGRGAVIGAGAVVTRDVEPYSIVAGNPAKIIRMRFDDKTIDFVESTKWWEWDIEELKHRARDLTGVVFRPDGGV